MRLLESPSAPQCKNHTETTEATFKTQNVLLHDNRRRIMTTQSILRNKMVAAPKSETEVTSEKKQYKWKIIWKNLTLYILMHILGLHGLYLIFTKAQLKTTFWAWFLLVLSLQGLTSAVHRFFCHRSYKAKMPLRIILCFFQTLSLQNTIHDWVTDHRVHHKFVDTDADPHNSRRGLFFSHMGWLFIEKHPDVLEKTKTIDVSDIEADPVVMYQKKYYFVVLAPLIGFVMPTFVPWYFWNEMFHVSFLVGAMLRYMLCTNIAFTVNSLGHTYGSRPYDKNIRPTNNFLLNIVTGGEAYHNYHHTFPWDYRSSEFGDSRTNLTTIFIDAMAKIGWAYDLKTVSEDVIMKRVLRTGDGSRKFDGVAEDDHHHDGENLTWGWGDKEMSQEEYDSARIVNSS